MFALFKRGGAPKNEVTLNSRVATFWDWFASQATAFDEAIVARHGTTLAAPMSDRMNSAFPGMAWNFGPGRGTKRHSFTFSGEGSPYVSLLAAECVARAPEIADWCFHAGRQANPNLGTLDMGTPAGMLSLREILVSLAPNPETRQFDVEGWHPAFEKLGEAGSTQVLFLALDAALGEVRVEQWLGVIEAVPSRPVGGGPLVDLDAALTAAAAKHGWEHPAPGEARTLYHLQPDSSVPRRGDVVVGQTRLPRLIQDFLEARGRLEDPLPDSGARLAWLEFGASALPQGGEAVARGEIEDALATALASASSGLVLGGAFAPKRAFVDLLLFDGEASSDIVASIARDRSLPAARMEPFDWASRRQARAI